MNCPKCNEPVVEEVGYCPYCDEREMRAQKYELSGMHAKKKIPGMQRSAKKSSGTDSGKVILNESLYHDYARLGGWLAFLLVRLVFGVMHTLNNILLSQSYDDGSYSTMSSPNVSLFVYNIIYLFLIVAIIVLLVNKIYVFRILYLCTSAYAFLFSIPGVAANGSYVFMAALLAMESIWIIYLYCSKRVDVYFGLYRIVKPYYEPAEG
ncbi:MAG: hypothetical protein ACYCX2_02025 [Christensenellales bacterium]